MSGFDLNTWAEPRREALRQRLMGLFADAWPEAFTQMCLHPLATGGKSVRPLLMLAAYEAVASQREDHSQVMPFAVALELIHTYSLVHDDMPCMDDDDFRRGRPTTHVLYGEAFALLVGDALLTEAFRLATTPCGLDPAVQLRLVHELATAAGYHGMIGGQAADLGAAGRVKDTATLLRLHEGKTGALIRVATRLGALIGGASEAQVEALSRYGAAVGLAFQLADDVLDLTQDEGEDGPPSFPKLLGVSKTVEQARFLTRDALDQLRGLAWPDPLAALARYAVEREV